MDSKKILFIEDDDFLRSLAVTKLQKEGLDVSTAENGEKGWETLQANKPDLLLLDIMLPGIDGWEILTRIRGDENLKDLKVIIFSNLGSEEDIQKGNTLGATDYLVKSNFTLDELVTKIAEILGA